MVLIGDEIAAALPELRAQAESLMVDTCRITKPGTAPRVLNQTTGKYDESDPIIVYEGPCKIPRRATGITSGAAAHAGEAAWAVGEYPLDIPVQGDGYKGHGPVGPGQTVIYLTAAYDPDLVGKIFGIVEPSRQSAATARRFRMKQTVGPTTEAVG